MRKESVYDEYLSQKCCDFNGCIAGAARRGDGAKGVAGRTSGQRGHGAVSAGVYGLRRVHCNGRWRPFGGIHAPFGTGIGAK